MTSGPWLTWIRIGGLPRFGVLTCDNRRAQNGPGIAVVEHRPGPDLSASLTEDEEH